MESRFLAGVCVLLLQVAFATRVRSGPVSVTFERQMQENDVIDLKGFLTDKRAPFLLEMHSGDPRGPMLKLWVRGRRGSIKVSPSPEYGLGVQYVKNPSIRAGGSFRILIRLHNNVLSIRYNNVQMTSFTLAVPIRVATMKGTSRAATIAKSKWHKYLCKTEITDCGRGGSIEVQDGLCPAKVAGHQQRIVGGAPANAGAHPWQVAIRKKGETAGKHPHICGGILIDSCWVLTAAHCFPQDSDALTHVVRVGDYYNTDDKAKLYSGYENSEEFNISKIIKHKKYWTSPSNRNDIALVRLTPTSNGRCAEYGRFVQPICLPVSETQYSTGQECVITGWGATEHGQAMNEYPSCLQQAGIFLLDKLRCKVSYPDVPAGERILDTMQCADAGPGGRADACQGDSGGPLVCSPKTSSIQGPFTIWGITSWGDGCGSKPGIYTKVASYLDWIDQSMFQFCKHRPQ